MPLHNYRIICDENIPRRVVNRLESLGYEVIRLVTYSPGMSDQSIMGLMEKQLSILITYDSDFGTLIFSYSIDHHLGCILYCKDDISLIQNSLEKVITHIIHEKRISYFITISTKNIRIKRI